MRRARMTAVLLGSGLLLSTVAAPGWAAKPAPTIRGGMNGAQEVPGPGDPDGSGNYALTFEKLNASSFRVCSVLRVRNIEVPTAAHIHNGARHSSGAVVVGLPLTLSDGAYRGCQDVDAATVQPILDNPAGFYVNVHNATYPNGAVRGQLHPVGPKR
jgi:hypothetical protein